MYFGVCLLLAVVFTACTKQQPGNSQIETPSGDVPTPADGNASKQQSQISELTFEPLKNGKTLKHEITKDNEGIYLKIYDSENNELMRIAMFYSDNYDERIRYSKSGTRMVVLCKPNAPDIFELWFIDGSNGIAKKVMRPYKGGFFQIDDDCMYICSEEFVESDVPTVVIFNIQTMERIKTVQYEPYRKKGMYAVKMSFSGNTFKVMLSADTVFFTTLEIPIDNTNDYRVVDSYNMEDFQQGKPFVPPQF
jgi:hypothetical protein